MSRAVRCSPHPSDSRTHKRNSPVLPRAHGTSLPHSLNEICASGAYEIIPDGIMKFDSDESSEMKSILCAAAHFTFCKNISHPKGISQIRRIYFVEKSRTLKPKSGFFLVREAGLELRSASFSNFFV